MKELITQYMPAILSVVGTLGAAFVALVVALLRSHTAKAELNTEKTELEKKKVELETTIYNGSYIFCPKCGEKIKLGEMTFHIDRKGD